MNIYLGNLSVEEIEQRVGVKFPEELVNFMNKTRQKIPDNVKENEWHCFDIPFVLMVGSKKMADKIAKYLMPLGHQFKEQLQISLKPPEK